MDHLPLARKAVKTVALVVGFGGTVVCLMAGVGLLTSRGWLRLLVALVIGIAIPALLADRLVLGRKDDAEGLASDVFAVTWMVITVAVAVVARPVSRPVLAAEADRLAARDMPQVASAVYWLAGVSPNAPSPDAGDGRDRPAETVAASVVPSAAPPAAPTASPASSTTEDAPATSLPAASARDGAAGAASDAPVDRAPEEDDEAAEEDARRHDPGELFERWSPSLATITVSDGRRITGATALLVGSAGRLITSHRVLTGAEAATVAFPGGAIYDRVDVLDLAPEEGLGVIRVPLAQPDEGEPPGADPFPIAEAAPEGEDAVLLSRPLPLEGHLATVALPHPPPEDSTPWRWPDPPIGAHDGGALVSRRGSLAGVIVTRTDGATEILAAPRLRAILHRKPPPPRPLASGRELRPR